MLFVSTEFSLISWTTRLGWTVSTAEAIAEAVVVVAVTARCVGIRKRQNFCFKSNWYCRSCEERLVTEGLQRIAEVDAQACPRSLGMRKEKACFSRHSRSSTVTPSIDLKASRKRMLSETKRTR